jgi:hypothetical protein
MATVDGAREPHRTQEAATRATGRTRRTEYVAAAASALADGTRRDVVARWLGKKGLSDSEIEATLWRAQARVDKARRAERNGVLRECQRSSVLCSHCDANLELGDDFCQSCGTRVSGDAKRILQEQREASDPLARERGARVRQATQAIIVLAALFTLGGIVMFFLATNAANQALINLASLDPKSTLPVDGVTRSVAELRELIQREPYQILGIHLLLAAIMGVLAVWSRRSPFPAVLTALSVFVVVHLVSAVLDPATIAQGIIIKVIAVVVLFKGVMAAYEARSTQFGARVHG